MKPMHIQRHNEIVSIVYVDKRWQRKWIYIFRIHKRQLVFIMGIVYVHSNCNTLSNIESFVNSSMVLELMCALKTNLIYIFVSPNENLVYHQHESRDLDLNFLVLKRLIALGKLWFSL